MSTKQRVMDIISRKVRLEGGEQIKASHNLRDDLNLDSLDLIELCMDLENDFDIYVPDEMIEGVTDVQSVIDVVERIVAAFTNQK